MLDVKRVCGIALFASLLACALPTRAADAQRQELLIFAAASLTNALDEIGAAYTRDAGQPLKFSYAASSALARQIEAGARADVFLSADAQWMDYLQARDLVDKTSRGNLLGNRLVLIAPATSDARLKITTGFELAASLGRNGRLATGDPDSVPAGRYARSALTALGVWNEVVDRLVPADNVRTALAFVARGEAPLGIVYETDALIEKKVRVVDVFPADSHPPIVYPVALTSTALPSAASFVEFLRGSTAAELFKKHGFTVAR